MTRETAILLILLLIIIIPFIHFTKINPWTAVLFLIMDIFFDAERKLKDE